MEEPKKSSALIWAVVVVVIALLAYGGYKYASKDSALTDNTKVIPPSDNIVVGEPLDSSGTAPHASSTQQSSNSGQYKDGSYTATGHYNSPGGAETIQITLVVKNDIITDASAVSGAFRPETKIYQGKFISGFKAQIVGKKLSEVSLTKVSGSSLTPKGFNDAVAQIRVQATA